MGLDVYLFVNPVDEELICPICMDVLEEAVQLFPCQHYYCRPCLTEWLEVRARCRVDGQAVKRCNVSAVPRSIQNILSRLTVRCRLCHHVMPSDSYRSHNCFQQILTQMVDYIETFDTLIQILESTHR